MAFVGAGLVAMLLALLPGATRAAPSDGPASFDCRRAVGWAEKAVCGDPSLADRDRRMADLFRRVSGPLAVADRQDLKKSQRTWVRTRNACVRDAAPLDCLARRYDNRIAELAALAGVGLPVRVAAQYTCADGRRIEAVFDNHEPQRVILSLAGATIELPQAVSTSGARYSDGQTVFWTKGSEAVFESAAGSTLCQVVK